jgi:subtilase family serine protease
LLLADRNSTPLNLAFSEPDPSVVVGGSTNLGPQDFYAFYDESPLKNEGITGTGCIAILGFSDFRPGPIQGFNSQFGLPDNSGSIQKILANNSNPGVIPGSEAETYIDLEWAHAVAPSAAIKYFLENSPSDPPAVDSFQAAVADGSCAIISSSISFCALLSIPPTVYTQTINNIAQQAQAQGCRQCFLRLETMARLVCSSTAPAASLVIVSLVPLLMSLPRTR